MTIASFRLNSLSAAMAVANSITATGGDTVSYYAGGSTNYKVHTFITTGSNNFIVSAITGSPTADILLVGGGGAGGGTGGAAGLGGGGGGGAVVYQTGVSISSQTYTISVGAGGTGVSSAPGNAGTQTTGLGYTAAGGGAGTKVTAATNGGGSGTNTSTSYTSTAGTYAYKGGNSFGSATASLIGAGGGAGAGGAGVNGASGSSGNAGLALQNNIDGNNYYYASGGGAGGGGQAYTRTGTLTGASSGGGGATSTSTPGNGGSATATTATYGGGGGGAASSGLNAFIGGSGKQGIAIIRYPVTNDFIYYVNSTTATTATLTLPTFLDGDIAILFQSATNVSTTIPTAVTPTGWTNVVNSGVSSTTSLRIMTHYKIMTAGESGTVLTGMAGTNNVRYMIAIYRPSRTYTISTSTVSQQATTAAPTNQTLTMTSITGPYIGVACYASDATISPAGGGSTTTATRDIGASTYNMKTFESIDNSTSFTNSTISMTDTGVNGMASFRLVLT